MRSRKFWAGVLFYAGMNMFQQDLMGLEKYERHMEVAWITLSPWWGVGVMVVAMIGASLPKRTKVR